MECDGRFFSIRSHETLIAGYADKRGISTGIQLEQTTCPRGGASDGLSRVQSEIDRGRLLGRRSGFFIMDSSHHDRGCLRIKWFSFDLRKAFSSVNTWRNTGAAVNDSGLTGPVSMNG